MLLAVLERRVGLKLAPHDIYAATVGGASLRTPASDLAVAIALTSAAVNTVVPERAVAFGEVGLAGELRRVPNIGQRLSEAARLGFTAAVIPTEPGGAPRPVPDVAGLTVMECPDLFSALVALRLVAQPEGRQPVELHVVG